MTRTQTKPCPECGEPNESDFAVCYRCRDDVPEHSNSWEAGDRYAAAFYVYALALNDDTYYIGQTRSLARRVAQHAKGHSRSTSGKKPKLIWFTTVKSRRHAANLEYVLKQQPDDLIEDMVETFRENLAEALPHLATRAEMEEAQNQASIQSERLHRLVDDMASNLKFGSGALVVIAVLMLMLLGFCESS